MTTTATTDVGAALTAAIQGGYVAQLTGQTYTITSPIVIHITSNYPGPVGIDGGGATLISQVTNGAPLIEIVADPGVSLRYLTLSNFTIAGNGHEGDGIQIVADGNDRGVYDFSVNNVNVQNVGGYGIDVRGNVFEGMVSNSWMSGNHLGGAYFTDTASGGIASALRWFGGGFQNNGGAGLTLDNGVRDMAVENAAFLNNHGPGIDAMSGITAVSDSTFVNNLGAGVDFQNYGNFDNNTFSTSGSQTIGMSAYLVNTATLVNNTSTYTGGGSDPTELANMRGPGGLFVAGDSGHIVTEASVQTSPILADVSIGTQGVAVPSLAPVTAATTAPAASSTGTSALETALKTAFASDTVAHLTAATYTVSKTIVINVTASMQGPVGIDLGGAKIFSQITDGSPVIEIIVGPGVNLNGLTLSNFLIEGTGQEGDGIKIVADGSDRSVQNATFSNLELEGLGGIGLDVLGNVSHGTVFDSWMNANAQGGARFANSAHGGVASGLEWTGGGFRQNGGAGLILDNGTHDMTVKGAYFVDNHGPGIDATSGLTLVQGSGFENNQGTGAIVQGSATFNGDTFSTYGPQTTGIGAYLAGGQVTVSGDLAEYYGAGSPTIPLADVQGQGTLAIAGNGPVVVGPNVTVTGVTAAAGTPTPSVTAKLVNDTGVSASDGITSNPALSGTADANSVVHFTVDGSAIAAIATANASGAWSFAPTGLTDGQHTLVASETNAAGKTGSASLSFTLDKTAPSVTEALASGGTTCSIPALTGKTDANAVVHCTVDGIVAGSTTANASGAWSYTPTGLADGQHTAVASVTDLAGNTTSSSFTFLLISTPTTPTVTAKLVNDTGVSASDGITSNPALSGTADANSVVHFTIDGSAIAATAATDANGAWSFTPIGLADGAHTIVASEINAAGGTGAASLAFTLDSHAPVPVVTGAVLANGQAIVTGTTGEANDTISLYDGGSLVGFTTTDSHGNWTVTAVADANVVHSYGANAIDLAGNEGHSNGGYVAGPPGGGGGAPPSLTEKLASDTGASSSDKITANPGLTGTADAHAVVHFTVDGSTIAATATADASGAWSYTPTGLADGAHTVVASETNAGGSTGAASLAFTLDTHAPIPAFTGDVVTNGQVTLTGTTGEANDTISLYDGNTWIGFATTGSNGTWSFTGSAPSSVVHSYGANATDLAGSEGHGAGKLILGSSGTDSLVGTAGNDVIAGNGGNDRITGGAGADRLTGGSGKVTFAYQAVKDSTFAASDTITDFRHGADKIDFGNIAGINATNGVPQFQGNITGSGNLTLGAHSVAYLEVGGNTQVLVNTSGAAEAVSSTDTHAADMNITLVGIHLGLTGTDFHHA